MSFPSEGLGELCVTSPFTGLHKISPGLHSIKYLPLSVCVTKFSLHPSDSLHHLFRREIKTLTLMKCSPNSTPQSGMNSYSKSNLKKKNSNANVSVKKSGLCFDLTAHFMSFNKIELASNYMHFWT